MKFDHDVYFNNVRGPLFGGALTQQQVDGQEAILLAWEHLIPDNTDLRWLAYMLATAKHETASTMWPIEEYGKGGSASYAQPAGPYGQCYYGRGFVQLTWWENYVRADKELYLTHERSCEKYPDQQLKPVIAGATMYIGMKEGWFRTHEDGKPETLERYFNESVNDPYLAREIINGDKTKVPDWSNGVSIGNLIADYHDLFLDALEGAIVSGPIEPPLKDLVVTVLKPPGVEVVVEDDL